MPFVWVITLFGAALGGFELFQTIALAKSAPQQAAGGAMALAYAVIPYVAARACEGFLTSTWRKDMLKALEGLPSDATIKTATDSLWKQLDSIRANGARPVDGAPLPVALAVDGVPAAPVRGTTAGMGYCPGCGRLRGLATVKCVYCGDTQAALEQAPIRA